MRKLQGGGKATSLAVVPRRPSAVPKTVSKPKPPKRGISLGESKEIC